MMDLKLGSNAFRNTSGVLTLQGREQIVLELKPETSQLLLTMDLYDDEGARIGHLRRNSWVLNKDQTFAFASGPDSPTLFTDHAWVKITARQLGETVLEGKVRDKDVVEISSARFFTHRGQLVEISSHYCRIQGNTTLFGDVQDMNGGPVRIG